MFVAEIIGNIGNDAQVKDFNGKKYIAFNVAHSEKFKNQQGTETERTTWVSVLKPGESGIVQYLKKGTPVFVRGDLSFKQYEDSSQQKQIGVNCLAREVQLLPGGKREPKPAGSNTRIRTNQHERPGSSPGTAGSTSRRRHKRRFTILTPEPYG